MVRKKIRSPESKPEPESRPETSESLNNEIGQEKAERLIQYLEDEKSIMFLRRELDGKQFSALKALRNRRLEDEESRLFLESDDNLRQARDLIVDQDAETARKNKEEHPELANYFKIVERFTERREDSKKQAVQHAINEVGIPEKIVNALLGRKREAEEVKGDPEKFAKILDILNKFYSLKNSKVDHREEESLLVRECDIHSGSDAFLWEEASNIMKAERDYESDEIQDKKNQKRGSELTRITQIAKDAKTSNSDDEKNEAYQEANKALLRAKEQAKMTRETQRALGDLNERMREVQNSDAAKEITRNIGRMAAETLARLEEEDRRKETLRQTGLDETQLKGIENLKEENVKDVELQLFFESDGKLRQARDFIAGQGTEAARKAHPELARYFKIVEKLTEERKKSKGIALFLATKMNVSQEMANEALGNKSEGKSTPEKSEQFAKILQILEQFSDVTEEYNNSFAESNRLHQSVMSLRSKKSELDKAADSAKGLFGKIKAQKELKKALNELKETEAAENSQRSQMNELREKKKNLRDEIVQIKNLLSDEIANIMK
ncbi:hypothetical protein IJ847_03080 [Candidatus Saccharibacteria bacterium]|nr:hypothetical protein [Candidatus Saccharibacteria bacterium]